VTHMPKAVYELVGIVIGFAIVVAIVVTLFSF
jgi:hypothetical protein